MEAEATPFPTPDITPPKTKIYLVIFILSNYLRKKI